MRRLARAGLFGTADSPLSHDSHSNQLNRLVAAIMRGPSGNRSNRYLNAQHILQDIPSLWIAAQLPLPHDSNIKQLQQLIADAIKGYHKSEYLHFRPIPATHTRNILLSMAGIDEEDPCDGEDKAIPEEKMTDSFLSTKTAASAPPILLDGEDDLTHITDAFDALSLAKRRHEANKQQTQSAITHALSHGLNGHLCVKRLFVGCGFANITLMSTDPSVAPLSVAARKQVASYDGSTELSKLSTLVITQDDTGTWTADNHRAEQEYALLEVPGCANASDFVPADMCLSSKVRTNTRHLYMAGRVNLGLKDTPPMLTGVKVVALQRQHLHAASWPAELVEYDARVAVEIQRDGAPTLHTFIYANTMDIALGLGKGRIEPIHDAMAAEHRRYLVDKPKIHAGAMMTAYSGHDAARGFTPILHGNAFDLDDKERSCAHSPKDRKVIIIGGGGGTGTAYRAAVYGTDAHGYRFYDADHSPLVHPGVHENPNVMIFARRTVSYGGIAWQAIESFEHARAAGNLYEGYVLIGTQVDPATHKITVRFHNRAGATEINEDKYRALQKLSQSPASLRFTRTLPRGIQVGERYYLLNEHVEVCDQLIATTGQNTRPVRDMLLREIDDAELLSITNGSDHELAVGVTDTDIRFHGALAANLSRRLPVPVDPELPKNGRNQNIMPCVTEKLIAFSALTTGHKRQAFNVNHCHLIAKTPASATGGARGAAASASPDKMTEFEIFLQDAGVLPAEAEALVSFLVAKRAEDHLTGTGVSHYELQDYLEGNALMDRLQIVGCCSLVKRATAIGSAPSAAGDEEARGLDRAAIPY